MSSSHDHSHDHDYRDATIPALSAALGVTAVVFLAELIAGLISGSLALLSDAMHMLSDSTGLIIALIAALIGRRAASPRVSYGYRRIEVLAALVNALTVTAVVVWILISAIKRLIMGNYEIETPLMIGVGVIGLVANMVSAFILMRAKDKSLNARGAYLHVLSDMLGSVAVVVAGVIIHFTGWVILDAIASLVIVGLVAPRALSLVMETVRVLMESAPHSVDPAKVEQALTQIDEVRAVHDLHIWSTNGVDALATCHLVVEGEGCAVLDKAQSVLRDLGIDHSTIQLENQGHAEHEIICD